jgi:hypothetical protein
MAHTGPVRFFAFCFFGACVIGCAGHSGAAARGRSENASAVIANGTWGGEHVVFHASGSGATVQFDCAHGAISAPLALDAEGRFSLAGDFVKEHGGPIRVGEVENHESARYSGRVDGRRMTLSVALGRDETLGPFTLALGSAGRVVRCR